MDESQARFEKILVHLDAAYNLARWLVRNPNDAEDVVQESMLRAIRFIDGFRGTDIRPWLLAIVRNTSYAWLKTHRPAEFHDFSDDEFEVDSTRDLPDLNPETLAILDAEKAPLNEAISILPVAFREVLILRELEELPYREIAYREIAEIVNIPIGTVMSRLSRARHLLAQGLGAIAQASVREGQR